MTTTLGYGSRLRRLAVIAIATVCAGALGFSIVRSESSGDLKYVFTVDIEGIEAGRFRQVGGLGIETEVIEFREGGNNEVVHKLPGATKWPNLVLKRGFTGDRALLDWAMTNFATGNVLRKTVTVTMLDQAGTAIARWTLTDAWPAKWTGPELDASKNEVAIETLEIAHTGMKMSRD
jgi:phage tail-like protein